MGAQRIFKLTKVVHLMLQPGLNFLVAVSEEVYKVFKIGHVEFANQKMNQVGFKRFGFYK